MHQCSCLCGVIKFEIYANKKNAVHCHCHYCRKVHASPYVTVFVVLPEYFNLLQGQDTLIRFPANSDKTGRYACGQCGSYLFTETAPGKPLSVHTSTLEDETGIEAMAHTNVESKSPATQITDNLPQFSAHITKDDYIKLASAIENPPRPSS